MHMHMHMRVRVRTLLAVGERRDGAVGRAVVRHEALQLHRAVGEVVARRLDVLAQLGELLVRVCGGVEMVDGCICCAMR